MAKWKRIFKKNSGEENITLEEIAEKRIKDWQKDPYRKGSLLLEAQEFGAKTTILNLSDLVLKKVPESLRKLKKLEVLDLENNKLEELPEWIGALNELKVIALTGNQLKTLPPQITKLSQLTTIYLRNNELESLPEGLQNLPLEILNLRFNKKLGIPASILEKSPREILRYYYEIQTEGSQPLQELKLLVVGRGKAGKTTLVKQLSGEKPEENESETHSISIKDLSFSCPTGRVQTRAWDFGGQEVLHSTHQFFLTERSLYLLVLEPRTGSAQKDAEYWLKLIQSQGGGSPAIVALNWSHHRKWQIDTVKLKRKFPFIVDFVSTDALYGDDIEDLQRLIIKTVEEKMPDVWLPFPKHWREIKDAVTGMENNYLTYKQFTGLCEQYGENRPDAQSDLASILHALGLVLYFGNDPRLRDTRVLNPSWVTGGVYAVIRSKLVKDKDGQLSVSDMAKVLKEAESQGVIKTKAYPKSTHGFILELMRAFQLCYASEKKGKTERYLVPELLSRFEPYMPEPWEKAPVRLRYRYTVLPPGLLPHFIVQTHALSEDEPHWRHGVVLKHSEAKVLVREETDSSELQVFILGEGNEERGVMVAMIRRELQILHNTLKIKPVEELELTGEGEEWISVQSLRDLETPQMPILKLPIQPEGTKEVHISKELDKLIPEEARKIDREQAPKPLPVRLFVCYARADERQLKRLDLILDILEQQHGLSSWTDKRLIAGDEWDEEIRKRLETMDIFLFIASQASLVSHYIKDIELKRAKERKDNNEIELAAVKLEPCAVDDDIYLGRLQRLATKYKSVVEAPRSSSAWEQVRKDLLPVIKRVRDKKKNLK